MFPEREKRFDYVEVSLGGFLKRTGKDAAVGTKTEKKIGKAVKGFVTGLFKRNQDPKKKRPISKTK